jgi:hypothetical protein
MIAKIFQTIENPTCLGDKWHNDAINILVKDVNKKSKYYKHVAMRLDNVYSECSHNWIQIPNKNCRKLNAIMKSKTEKTFIKRIKAYINELAFGTHYGKLFNKDEIREFTTLLSYYENQK